MKDLLRIADLAPHDLELLLDTAEAIHADPYLHHGLFEGDTVVTHFAKPSTRTRLSFGSAIAHLGGVPEDVRSNELQLGRGETIEDTARVISRYARAFVIGTHSDEDVRRFAAAATIPVINALTDGHHPCQVLADLLTLKQHFGSLSDLRLAYLGDGNNVAHSLLEAAGLAGVHIIVATPPGYEVDPGVLATAEGLAERHRSLVLTTHDPLKAAAGADAVYTDGWMSIGDSDDTTAVRVHDFAGYQVDEAVMAEAAPGAVFMHCLPAHRGEEVSAGVIDGPQSAVVDEAENGMPIAQAVLVALATGALTGANASEAGVGLPT